MKYTLVSKMILYVMSGFALLLLVACSPSSTEQAEAPAPDGLEIEATVSEVPAGKPFGVTVKAIFADGEQAVTEAVEWEFEGAARLLDMDASGRRLVRPMTTGTLTLMPSYRGVSGRVSVSVTPEVLESIAVVAADNKVSWPKGVEVGLRAVARYSLSGEKDISELVQWSSDDDTVARLLDDSPGRIKAAELGSTRVFARLNEDFAASLQVEVTPAALTDLTVALLSGAERLAMGSSETVVIEGRYSDGRRETLTDYSWRTDGSGQVILDNGVLTASGEGEVALSVSVAGVQSGPLRLQIDAVSLSRVYLRIDSSLLPAGVTLPISVEARNSDGSSYTGELLLDWSLSTGERVKLIPDNDGGMRLQTLQPGEAEILAQVGDTGISASLTVRVVEAGTNTLQLTEAVSGLLESELASLAVVAVSAEGELDTVPGNFSCVSSDETVVLVNQSLGLCSLTALAPGEVEITLESADSATRSNSVVVRVDPLPVIGSLTEGNRFQLNSSRGSISGSNGRRLQAAIGGAAAGRSYLLSVAPSNGGYPESGSVLWTSPVTSTSKTSGACRALPAQGRTRITCQVDASSSGLIYVGVEDSEGDTPLDLEISEGGYSNQGSVAAPLTIELDTLIAGEVSANAINNESVSHYQITGLSFTDDKGNQLRYRVSLLQATETVILRVSRPGVGELCSAPANIAAQLPGETIDCLVDVGTGGALQIGVYGFDPYAPVAGASAIGGATFQLRVSKESLPGS